MATTKTDETIAAETKTARPARKTAAKAAESKPEVYVQYQGAETGIDALLDAATASFRETKKRTKVTDIKLYVKPEEHAAYYVINGQYEGKVEF